LLGRRRVEECRPHEAMRVAHPGETLSAAELPRNPVPAEAL